MLLTDIPYLEPLWLHLRADTNLKSEFTEASFFMPHNNLITATEEAIKNNCPAPRALWILPQDTLATSRLEGCKSPGTHTFYIQIIVQCIRDPFEIVKVDGEIELKGQFMELMALRKLVKTSVAEFSKKYKTNLSPKFDSIYWVKDAMLFPSEENNRFLSTAIQFDVKIF